MEIKLTATKDGYYAIKEVIKEKRADVVTIEELKAKRQARRKDNDK